MCIHWAHRIWVGDAHVWSPPRSFAVVHGLLDTGRPDRRRNLIERLLSWVEPGGRLVLSHYGAGVTARELAEALGYVVDGETSTPTTRGGPSIWLLRQE